MYDIQFTANAEKQLKKLEHGTQQHIIAVLERARIRPEAHFQRLVGVDAYRLRIGKYRAIADITHNTLTILVLKIGHRKNIYGK